MLKIGITGHGEVTVNEYKTARTLGSGELPVLATPALVALVEETAWRSIAGELEPGQGTVGTRIDLRHLSATPLDMRVWCDTELTEIDRRKLIFSFTAYDPAGKIAVGTHERFIVDNSTFLSKAQSKADSTIPPS